MTVTTHKESGVIINDGQDFLQTDANEIVQNYQDNDATRTIELQQNNVYFKGGIIEGLRATAGVNKITVSPGKAYTRDGKLVTLDVSTDVVVNSATDTGKYVVLTVSIDADSTTDRAHPYSGVTAATRSIKNVALAVQTITGIFPLIFGVTETYIVIDYIRAFNVNTPLIGSVASKTVSNVKIEYANAGVVVGGDIGSKQRIRFSSFAGSALTVTETSHPDFLDVHYLDVHLATDSVGTIISTNAEVVAAINSFSTHFFASLIAAGTFTYTSPDNDYEFLSNVSNLRQYFSPAVGSDALSTAYRIDRFFPNRDPFTKHITSKGTNAITESNPHGMTAADLGIDGEDLSSHRQREHTERCGISNGSDIGFLATTLVTANTKVNVAGQITTDDRCVVQGNAITEITNKNVGNDYQFGGTSNNFILYEVIMISDGSIAVVNCIEQLLSTGVGSIIHNNNPVLSFVSKQPYLEKVVADNYLLTMEKTGVNSYRANLNGGAWVNVSTTGTTYTLYDLDGYWIKVYKEDSNGMAIGTYSNYLTCVKSEQEDLYLKVSYAFWRGIDGEFGYGAGLTYDTRVYGTDSLFNNIYIDNSLLPTSEYHGGNTLLASSAGLVVTTKPIDLVYKGKSYKMGSQTITLDNNASNFVIASFDSAKNLTIVNRSGATVAYNTSTELFLSKIVTAGGVVTSSSYATEHRNMYAYNQKVLPVGDDVIGTTIDGVLTYIEFLQNNTTAGNEYVVELHSDVTMRLSHTTIKTLGIRGNGYTITANTAGLSIEAEKIIVSDAKLINIDVKGLASGSDEVFVFNDCELAGVKLVSTTSVNQTNIYLNRTKAHSFRDFVFATFNSDYTEIAVDNSSFTGIAIFTTKLIQATKTYSLNMTKSIVQHMLISNFTNVITDQIAKITILNNDLLNFNIYNYSPAANPNSIDCRIEHNRITQTVNSSNLLYFANAADYSSRFFNLFLKSSPIIKICNNEINIALNLIPTVGIYSVIETAAATTYTYGDIIVKDNKFYGTAQGLVAANGLQIFKNAVSFYPKNIFVENNYSDGSLFIYTSATNVNKIAGNKCKPSAALIPVVGDSVVAISVSGIGNDQDVIVENNHNIGAAYIQHSNTAIIQNNTGYGLSGDYMIRVANASGRSIVQNNVMKPDSANYYVADDSGGSADNIAIGNISYGGYLAVVDGFVNAANNYYIA